MPEVKKNTIFISYRRKDGATVAQLIYNDLCHRGYELFYDRQILKTGRFDEKILAEVRACTDMIVIPSKNALVQRGADEDWYCGRRSARRWKPGAISCRFMRLNSRCPRAKSRKSSRSLYRIFCTTPGIAWTLCITMPA